MLSDLHVRDFALIEDVWLELGPGMTVLTGETGAGKTALLGALGLLLGERADSQTVREGASEALVEGTFVTGGTDVIVRRRLSADGRSRCQLSGEMATVGQLGDVVGPLVELHGQHEHQALLSPASHVEYLDRWAGEAVESARSAYRSARSAHAQAARAELETLEELERAQRDTEQLSFMLEEIDRVAPRPGEDDELEARVPALQHAERLSEAAAIATAALRGDGGALDSVARAADALQRVAGIDPALDEVAARIQEVQALLDDLSSGARGYRDAIEHDQGLLDATLSRLSALSGLKRKYGPTLADVLERGERARVALDATTHAADVLARMREATRSAAEELRGTAQRLEEARRAAVTGFTGSLAEVAAELSMEAASFEVAFAPLPFDSWTDTGPHRVEFLYSPGPGQSARPLARIASGGEISRVMLAIKGVLGSADTVGTLVFDEVDAGIGGSVAHAVGRRLKMLSATHQVIVVTHLAQVAAYADHQLVVTKSVSDAGTRTDVSPVSGEDRVLEIARMLSGNASDASIVHARELLAEGGRAI